ncbi:CRTAC1 family protein [Stagnihabitans tardus]|uniref:ASPIC/UnbV domain-containing protein n=1 Tax=Stagnihabitans tardus TaxID=2699202 RepID=A0AAE4Y8T2_9RHOB|nr:CRTAC1 family protein [Stagnihabitans tardus]NBZ87056.1 hypothetical protein [Stagnihabitans tardus]
MRKSLALTLVLAMPALAEPVVPQFQDQTATSGVVHSYEGDWQFMVGGGVAAFDCSGDSLPELFFAGGTAPAALYLNESKPGALSFRAQVAGLEETRVTGAWPLDIDSDGVMDLVVLRSGEDLVMRGLGQCRFERMNEAWGFEGRDLWSSAFAATWEKGADWPTLAVGTYIDRKEEAFPWGSCTENLLYRPKGQGFAEPLELQPSFCALSMLFTDWNLSGTPSLRVSNDREYYKGGTEQMWHVPPGEAPKLYGKEEGWKPLKIWGMGIASADVNGDLFPDYYLTSMADQKLQTLAEGPGKPVFKDVAFAMKATAHRPYTGGDERPSTGWHAEFQDVNDDGFVDLFVAKGNVEKMPDFAQNDPNNLLLGGEKGFTEAGDRAGVASMAMARGASVVDLDGDGRLDLVVANRHSGAELWRNKGLGIGGEALGHWLMLAPVQEGANRDAVGGWIEVRVGDRVQRRELTVGGGQGGGQIGWRHFGIGAEAAAEVRVIWPDGSEGPWENLAADSFYHLPKGGAAVKR